MTARRGQGEAVITWAVWTLLLVVVVVTYSRLPLSDLYRVSHAGIAGGIGRGVVLSNYPISLAAIALILIAMDGLPRAAWWAAGPAIVLCAATTGTVDPGDLDFRLRNILPALGVVIAASLTFAAARRAGPSFVSRRPGDRARIVVAVTVVVLSLPWLAADLGTYLPGPVFLTSTIVTEGAKPAVKRPSSFAGRDDPGDRPELSVETLPAVHRGHHHGIDGALLFLTAVLLSRVRPGGRRLDTTLTAYAALMLSYGGVNGTEDAWHEQIVKRGWVHVRIPSAQVPGLSGVTLVMLVLTAVAYLVFRCERRFEGRGGATNPSFPARP